MTHKDEDDIEHPDHVIVPTADLGKLLLWMTNMAQLSKAFGIVISNVDPLKNGRLEICPMLLQEGINVLEEMPQALRDIQTKYKMPIPNIPKEWTPTKETKL